MKLLKKLLWLGATLSAFVGLSALTACNKTPAEESQSSSSTQSSESAPEDDNFAFVYRVSLQNATGFGFSGATVKLMDGDTVVASKRTNASGNANFLAEDIAQVGNYTIVVENAPKGYALPESVYKTVALAGTETVIPITPTGILQDAAPAGTYYRLGDVVHDFTVTLSDNTTYTLSEVLQEKDLVLLNFWATWCAPCKSEFPAMHNAAIAYQDNVSVLAVSTTDSKGAVAEFKSSNAYSAFNMAAAGSGNLAAMFGVSSIPHTVIIDRYGVVAFNHVGSMPSMSAFTVQFDKFVGEDYLPTVVSSLQEEEEEENPLPDEEQMKPNVPYADVKELADVFTTETTKDFTFRYQEEGIVEGEKGYDEYNWPWAISEDKQYLYATNGNIHNSYAILYSDITVKTDDVLTFDYKVGSEERCDYLHVLLDGVLIKSFSGYHSDQWYTTQAYVFKDFEAGKHELAFVFMKDSDKTANDDVVYVKDLRIQSLSDIDSPSVDANIFRYAATQKNEDSNAKTQFKNYVDVYLNDEDSYYHVGAVDGPVLYANMLNASPWNQTSVWLLAYNDYVVGDGMNFHAAMEAFAWEAAQITDVYGYTPVTADLQYLLDAACRYVNYGEKWSGAYHDKEWLEICVYYEHYGQTELPKDPMAGITFTAAIQMQEGENEINVPYAINPRGFKYKFIPERSGAYHVYSTGESDSVVFLMAEDRTTLLGDWDNKVFVEVYQDENGVDVTDGNFEFYWYFEEGKTYYMLFTTYLDQAAKYNVNIDWLGETYTYLDNAAVGPYSANLNTFELFLPSAIEYAYSDPDEGGDGYYHHVKENGELGGVIYLDVNRPTAFFNSMSLYNICRQAVSYEAEKRALYIDGVDYTEAFMEICFFAMQQTGNLKGFAAVDKKLFDLLCILTRSAKYDGIENSWLLLCYYEKTLAPSEN